MKKNTKKRHLPKRPVMNVKDEEGGFHVSAKLGEEWVSRLFIWDMTWRVGCSHLRMGGVGGVETKWGHRNKGYSTMCLDRAVLEMRRRGYDMSSLFGIPNYYYRWGFVSALPDYRLKMATRILEESVTPKGMRARPFNKTKDAAQVLSIYVRNNFCRTASQIRPSARTWKSFRRGSDWFIRAEAFVVTGKRGRVAGYAAHDKSDSDMVVSEVGFARPEVFPALAAEIARRAVRRRTGEVVFCLPLDHEFAAYLRKWDCREEARFSKWGGGMARIIAVEPVLRKCSRTFADRIRNSTLRGKSFSLAVITDIGSATIISKRGAVRVKPGARGKMKLRVSQGALTQLILGYRDLSAVRMDKGVSVSSAAVGIAETLFPRGYPHMWCADHF